MDINEILGRQINSVKQLKTAIKELQDSLVGVDAESEEYKATSQQLAAAQDELNKVTRAGKQDFDAAKDSLVGMRQEYKALYDQYKLLSDEQRKSPIGKEMAANLETLSDKINETQKSIGDYRGNVGRYAESVVDAFNKMGISLGGLKGPLDLVKNGSKGLGKIWKDLTKNPLLLTLTIIVGVLAKVAAAIKQNEELTDRLKQALSVFQPVLNFISNAFDWLAEKLVKVVEGFAKVSEKVLSIIPGFKKAKKETQALAKAQDDLNKKQREASVENSKKQAEVARLREDASATEDVMEKKRLLEEAKEKQREIDEENIRLAQEELDILQRQSQLTANSAADNDALAAAQKKVNDAVAQGSANMRQYNKELGKVDNQVKKTTGGGGGKSKVQQEREEVEKLTKELIEYYKTEEEKLTEKYNRERKLMEKHGHDTTNLTRKYNEDRLKIIIEDTKKEKEIINTFLDGQVDNINRYYTNLKSIYTRETEKFFIDGKKLEEFKKLVENQELKIKTIINNAAGDIQDMWKYIFNNADLRNLDDPDYMKEFLSVFTTEIKKEDIQKIINGFNSLMAEVGEEGWIALTSGLTNTIKNLNNVGIDIKNLPDFTARIADLGNEAAKAFGDSFNAHIEEVIKDANEASMQLELDMLKNTDTDNYVKLFRDLGQLMAENTYDTLSAQKVAYEEELLSFSGTQEQKLEIMYKYYDVVKQMQENNLNLQELNRQRTIEMFESLIDLSDRIGSAMSTYRSSQEQMIESQLKAGKIDEDEAKKKKKRLLDLQKVETAFNIATIVADAASGLFSIWKGYAMEVGTINPQTAAATGPAAAGTLAGLNAKSLITAIAKSAGLAATATAQVAAARGGYVTAKNNLAAESSGGGSGSGSGTGVASTPYLIDSQPFSYTRTLQTEQEEELNNRPIVVKVSDILDGIDTHNVQVTESTF